jgi:Tol biopolymer transport system component
MTEQNDLEQLLRGHYRMVAAEPVLETVPAADASDVMARVARLRQRPGWLVETLGNGSVTAPRFGWRTGTQRAAILALLGLLIVLAAVWIAGQPPTLPGRGLLAFSLDGDIYLSDPDGGNARLVVHEPGQPLAVDSWSADGRWLKLSNQTEELGGQSILLEASTLRTRVVEGWSQWAPRGSSLAVSAGIGRGASLAVLDPDTGDLRRVATGLAEEGFGLGWSPDATRFAVADGALLRVADIAAGDVHDLEPFGPDAYVYDGSWSPDGRSILCIVSVDTGGSARTLRVARVEVSSGDVTILIEDAGSNADLPLWSPDGGWLLALIATDLVRVDATTGEAKVLRERLMGVGVQGFGVLERLSWSPDGAHIGFENGGALWVIGVDGSGLTQISPIQSAPWPDLWPDHAWSPDGEWIAYWGRGQERGYPKGLVIARRDGRETRHVVAGIGGLSSEPPGASYGMPLAARVAWQALPRNAPRPVPPAGVTIAPTPRPAAPIAPPVGPPADPGASWTGFAIAHSCTVERLEFGSSVGEIVGGDTALCDLSLGSIPTWAPDGSAVLFDAQGETVQGEPIDEFLVLARDGAILMRERPKRPGVGPDTPKSDREPISFTWSQDGRWLHGCAWTVPPVCLMVHPDGGGYRELPGPPSWSRDGSRLAVSLPDGNLLVGRGDGTDLRPIGTFPLPASWSPDGTRFAFLRDGNVWVVGNDGIGARAVTMFEMGGASDALWSPAGDLLLVRRGSTWSIVAVESDGETRPLDIPNEAEQATWSPDGRSISFLKRGADRDSTLIVQAADGRVIELESTEEAPVWSPGGRFLAVMSAVERVTKSLPRYTFLLPMIDVVRADGSGRRTIWTDESGGISPSITWLP